MKLSFKDFCDISNFFAVPILILDPTSACVLFCNESFEELTGKTIDQVKNLDIYALFVAHNRKKIDAIISLTSGADNIVRIGEKDLEIKRRSGRKSPVDVYCKSVQLLKKQVLVFSLIDLSEIKEKQLEREFLINQNLRSSKLADLGRLAQGIAHELNNPLSIIVGNIDVLSDQTAKKEFNYEIATKVLNSMVKHSQRMTFIVRKLLDFYKTEDINFKEANSKEIIRETINDCEYFLNFHKISLYIDIADTPIVCDPLYIKQVLSNLMKNAITALENAPLPRVITIRVDDILGEYVISINNNGAPMNDKVKEKIFTPFFTTKDVGEGIGLSLYLSEKIMKIHQGSLSFDSNYKFGTTFFLHFPKMTINLRSKPESKILIISKEMTFRSFLANKLEQDEFKIIEAQDLADTRNLFHYPLSAIVIDVEEASLVKSTLFQDLIGLHPQFPVILFYPPEFDLKLRLLKMNNLYFYPKPIRKTDYDDMIHLITLNTDTESKKAS